jgi:hypothetical protein
MYFTPSHLLILDNEVPGPAAAELLRRVLKLTKLFAAYSSERQFEFLIMHNARAVVDGLVQICQHEAEQFNKPAGEIDDARLEVLGKIVVNAVSTIRNLLRAISDPKILDAGYLPCQNEFYSRAKRSSGSTCYSYKHPRKCILVR